MSSAMDKCKTAQELRDDLLALKLRLAFQEKLEEEIEAISGEQHPEPELQAMMDRADSRILKLIHTNVRKRKIARIVKTTLPQLGKAVAACLLAFFIGLSTAIAAVPAVRTRVLRFIMTIDEKYTSLGFADTGMAVNVPTEWKGRYYLSYIPDGFVFEDADGFDVTYADSRGNILLFSEYGTESSVNIDTEDADVRFIDIQGHSALLSAKNGWATLAWAAGDRYFVLDFQGDAEEAVRIAEGVVLIR